jgi:hypothetical protein
VEILSENFEDMSLKITSKAKETTGAIRIIINKYQEHGLTRDRRGRSEPEDN